MNIPPALLERVSRFDLDSEGLITISLANPETGRWKVTRYGSEVLSAEGKWLFEPMPSSRTPEFIADTRHTLEECLALATAKGLIAPS